MGFSVYAAYSLVRRVLVVWAVEVLGLWALARVLPGLHVEGWQGAVWGVAVIGLLNALVRPVLVALTLPFTVLSFGFLTIGLNAVIVVIAGSVVPGLYVSNLGAAAVTVLGLAVINTLMTSVINLGDEDSFYRNFIKRLAGRSAPPDTHDTPGIVFLEIDGLSRGVLEKAMLQGHMPTLRSWLARGSHSLVTWDCGLPSQTSSSQAGILFGDNFDIPAFRWFDKDRGQVVVSNNPGDAMALEDAIAPHGGLLRDGGLSLCNMFGGGADKSVATISTYGRGTSHRSSPVFFSYYLNPYNFTRGLVRMAWELGVEAVEAMKARAANVRPRVSRGGNFPLQRAISTVFQHDYSVYLLMGEMFSGVPIAYTTFVGYDVVGHHAGPESPDALRILRNLDSRIHTLRRAADDAPRVYHFVVLSDHGHSRCVPFRQLYGQTLEQLVPTLLADRRRVHGVPPQGAERRRVRTPRLRGEGWGHLNALLSEAIRHERFAGRAARRLLRRRTTEGTVVLEPSMPTPADTDVVVCASGNLGLIYFAGEPGRMPFETIAARHPQLVAGLVAHPGIDFVLAHSAEHGPIVIGRTGVRYLGDGQGEDRVEGEDPLAHHARAAADHLRRLDTFPHSGDLVVNGRFDPAAGTVVAFEEHVGCHGGLGGAQTEAFLLYPSSWKFPASEVHQSADLYHVLWEWRAALQVSPAGQVPVDTSPGPA